MNKVLSYILTGLVSMLVAFGCVYLVKSMTGPKAEKVATTRPSSAARPSSASRPTSASRPSSASRPASEPKPAPAEVETKAQEPAPAAQPAPQPVATPEPAPAVQQPAPTVQQQAPAASEDVAAPVILLSRMELIQTAEGTFTVKNLRVKEAPVGELTYELSDKENHRYTSQDGQFEGVAPNSTGQYTLVVTDSGTGKNASRLVKGFILQKEVTRLTEDQVAALFNTGNAGALSAHKDQFVAKPKINCNQAGINTLSGVFQGVSMDGYTASVSNLEYDSLGRIVSMTVTLN